MFSKNMPKCDLYISKCSMEKLAAMVLMGYKVESKIQNLKSVIYHILGFPNFVWTEPYEYKYPPDGFLLRSLLPKGIKRHLKKEPFTIMIDKALTFLLPQNTSKIDFNLIVFLSKVNQRTRLSLLFLALFLFNIPIFITIKYIRAFGTHTMTELSI